MQTNMTERKARKLRLLAIIRDWSEGVFFADTT